MKREIVMDRLYRAASKDKAGVRGTPLLCGDWVAIPNINDCIGGSYRIIAEIGRGNFASVYKATHIIFEDEPIVAIKLLHSHLVEEQEYTQFQQEARLLRKLKHPHILPIINAGIHERSFYIIMEYAPGGSLWDHIQKRSPAPFPLDEAITILSQVGQALQYTHQQNVIHHDIKPANILFHTTQDALLADFGLAIVLNSIDTQHRSPAHGCYAYMAPEQFRGCT